MRSQIKMKPVVIVTGCGSGIGFELAQLLKSKNQHNVIATCRAHRIDQLKQEMTETPHFKIRVLDITDEKNIYQLVHDICAEWGRVDVVVNNAAVCYRGVVEHMDSESEMRQLKTNYLGPMALIRAVLPIMREQRSGQIINISSVSGILAMPTMGSYSASKHALEGATESLWYETQPFGINVNLIELGFIKSDAFRNVILSNKAQMSSLIDGPHSEYYSSMTPFIERLMSLSLTSSRSAASRILKIIEKNSNRLRFAGTPDVLIFSLLKRILPSSWQNRLFYSLLPQSIKWGGHWKKQLNIKSKINPPLHWE